MKSIKKPKVKADPPKKKKKRKMKVRFIEFGEPVVDFDIQRFESNLRDGNF